LLTEKINPDAEKVLAPYKQAAAPQATSTQSPSDLGRQQLAIDNK
jgi:hypothetical protein